MSLDLEIATTSYGVLCGAGENCWDQTLQVGRDSQHTKRRNTRPTKKRL